MSDLHEKVLEKCEFDNSIMDDVEFVDNGGPRKLLDIGGETENARLLPIITQLLRMNEELVCALEQISHAGIQSEALSALHYNRNEMEKLAEGEL
jgi:hypothetical protein